jgi:acyl-CoA-dependent ceramide synthase
MASAEVKPLTGPKRPRQDDSQIPERYRSLGFWEDVRTGRWMLVPCEF